MRTLFISDTVPYPLNSGGKQRNYHLLQALARVSDVTLTSFLQPNDDPINLQAIRHLYEDLYVLPCGYQIVRSSRQCPRSLIRLKTVFEYLHPTQPASFRWYHSQEAVDLFARLCANPFDLVWIEKLFSINLLPPALNSRIIVDLHDIESKRLSRRLRQAAFNRFTPFDCLEYVRLRRLERNLPRLPFEFTVCSVTDKQGLGGGPHLTVVPNGVDLPAVVSMPELGCNYPVFLFVGTMNYLPNVDAAQLFARRIFPRIRRHVADARFFIVGRDPAPEVQQLHDGCRIIVTGTVPDVETYLRQATAVVVPIRFGGGTRIKILEAMAHGKAVVSTHVGAEGIEGESGKHFLLEDNVNAFANACRLLVQDVRLRERLGREGRHLVRDKYTWDQIERQVEQLVTAPRNNLPSPRELAPMVGGQQ